MGRNKGYDYEDKIKDLLKSSKFLPNILVKNDAGFIHRGKSYFLEVKNNTDPDFGQKELKWNSNDGWAWATPDVITDLYDEIGAINEINSTFVPRRFTVDRAILDKPDRKYDQAWFEKTIALTDEIYIHRYYAQKKCYYIQIENKGFYYLEKDIAKLGVPKFDPALKLRFRAKFRGGPKEGNYGFLVVLMVDKKSIIKSSFDLERKSGKKFPPIIP